MKNHEYFMRFALKEGQYALQLGDFPVGCVLVAGQQIVSRARRLNSAGQQANELEHAEVSALRALLAESPGFDCSSLTIYSTMEPCLMCFATLLLSGVRRFVWAYEDVMGGATGLELDRLNPLYAGMKIEVVPGMLRKESLALFKEFFRKYEYWQGSLLSEYTLAQPVEET